MKVYPFIAAEKAAAHKVQRACALLLVSRSGFYAWSMGEPSAHQTEDQELETHIVTIHQESRGTYGAPRIERRLRQDGRHTSRKRVARIMRTRGICGRQKRRFKKTTISDGTAPEMATDLLQRDFAPRQLSLDEAWVGDITYIRTWTGWAYLATVMDLASRRVVGFATADHMRTSLIEEAMTMALRTRKPAPGLIFHTDRGSQYTSHAFRELLASNGVRQSLSRPRQCWDNAVAESFFSTLKVELIYRKALETVAAVRAAVFEYIEVWYNRRRLHSSLGYLSPAAYETRLLDQRRTAVPAA